MRDFYFHKSSDTLWISADDNPALARFGRAGYEIAGLPSQMTDRKAPVSTWRAFAAALRSIHIAIDARHAPPSIIAHLPADERPAPQMAPVATFSAIANPFIHDVWGVGPLDRSAVVRALERRRFVETPFHAGTHLAHTRRVAWLIAHPDAWTPIELHYDRRGASPQINDGFHRIAAAIFLDHEYIAANFSGSNAAINAMVGAIEGQPS